MACLSNYKIIKRKGEIKMSGLLNLEGLEGKAEDDILSANINEDVSVSVPGGLKEEPERNNGKEESVSVPATTTLTDKQYKDALSALQKSFKEGYEIMEALANATVVHENIEQKQDEFVENAIEQAILEAYLTGPIFEAVNRTDKKDISDIIKDIRNNIVKEVNKESLDFFDLNWWMKLKAKLGFRNFGQHFLWQFIGIIEIEPQNVSDFCKNLTDKFKDKLGEYKILSYQCIGFTQLFAFKNLKSKLAGDTKNTRVSYVLFIDRKMQSELKNELDALNKEIKAKLEAEEKKNDKKED